MNQKRRDRRLEMVIPFLQGKKSVHEVALENKMSKSGVEYWIKQARKDLETTGQDVKSTFVPADFVELSLKDKEIIRNRRRMPPIFKLKSLCPMEFISKFINDV